MSILSVKDLSVQFPTEDGLVNAVNGVSFSIEKGKTLGIVGESGSGKSVTSLAIMGLHKGSRAIINGQINLNGTEINSATEDQVRQLRGKSMAMIFQDALAALHPFYRVGDQIAEAYLVHNKVSKAEAKKHAIEMLDRVGIPEPQKRAEDYPHQFSGGMRQRLVIAIALALNPKMIIMDEPTSSLTPAETESLFKIIRNLKASGRGVVYISHRLEELAKITDRITVLRDGQYVKTLKTSDTSIPEVISLMVGRTVAQDQRPANRNISTEEVLRVEGISDRHLLRDVSFELRKGEILGFAGLMGAGRTELARAIIGADPRTAGKIYLHGKEVKIKQPSDAVAAGIGYLSEDRKRFGLLLIQNIVFNTILSSIPRFSKFGWLKIRPAAGVTRDSIAQLRVRTPSENQFVKNLSGGNQQKVVIGKWLTRNCEVLIFDEPTRGIDVGAKDEIYRLLTKLSEEGKSIIMISSELPEILRMSDRIAVMCHGRLTGILKNEDADQEKIIEYATKFSNELSPVH